MKSSFLTYVSGLYLACAVLLASCERTHDSARLRSEIETHLASCPAQVGVAVILPDGDTIVVNDGMYPMNSVLKLFQSLPIAQEMSLRGISALDTCVILRSGLDSDTWSPMLVDYTADTILVTYSELMSYALRQSDNNACDALFSHILSPAEVQQFWNERGERHVTIKTPFPNIC